MDEQEGEKNGKAGGRSASAFADSAVAPNDKDGVASEHTSDGCVSWC